MGHEAFGVDLAALKQAEQGVRDAVAELGEMAGWGGAEAGAEGMGMKEGIIASAGAVGHDGLAEALATFADKWEWGVRFLVDDGVDTADALSDTRAWYQKIDDEAIGLLKDGLHNVIGNPSDAPGSWHDKSWGEIGAEAVPDWSIGSFTESFESTASQAEGVTGWDLDGDGRAGGGGQ